MKIGKSKLRLLYGLGHFNIELHASKREVTFVFPSFDSESGCMVCLPNIAFITYVVISVLHKHI